MNVATARPAPPATPLQALAMRAGVQPLWLDAWDRPCTVADDVLRRVLAGLGLACATDSQCEASRAWLDADDATQPLPPLLTADQEAVVHLPWRPGPDPRYRLELEDGRHVAGTAAREDAYTLKLPPVGTCGYHRLSIGDAETTLAVAPSRCYLPEDALREAGRRARRAWGVAVQLYSLRRGAPAGLGDLTALAICCQAAARKHADAVAITPLHAGFSALPERFSPYAPSSRLFRNPLYVDPCALFGQGAVDSAVAALGIGPLLARHERRARIDWAALSPLRYAVLRWLWQRSEQLLAPGMLRACAAFRSRGGSALHAHACYEAIQARRMAEAANRMHTHEAADWRCWPVPLRSPADPAVTAFASAHAEEIAYHSFLQWLACDGLARAQHAAREAGMAIGIIADLAVGTDPGGSHAWSHQQEFLTGFHAGAPPDRYNPQGQDWGGAVFSPRQLRRHGYAAFIDTLRANLAHAGGLRIDHVLGLARVWLVPAGASAREGAYFSFPLQDLLRLVVLESWRHRAIIVGENLGTVPAEFDTMLSAHGVLGIGVLWFERVPSDAPPAPAESTATTATTATTAGTATTADIADIADTEATAPPAFLPPALWPVQAVATSSTHDLPTIAGWWWGRDLAWRARLGLLAPGESLPAAQGVRALERTALWQALCAAGLAGGAEPARAQAPVEAVLAWLGRTPAPLRLVPLEDLLGLREQPNLPGTTSGHPNWQRRLDADVRDLFDAPAIRARAAALRSGRLRGAPPPLPGTRPTGASP